MLIWSALQPASCALLEVLWMTQRSAIQMGSDWGNETERGGKQGHSFNQITSDIMSKWNYSHFLSSHDSILINYLEGNEQKPVFRQQHSSNRFTITIKQEMYWNYSPPFVWILRKSLIKMNLIFLIKAHPGLLKLLCPTCSKPCSGSCPGFYFPKPEEKFSRERF